MNDFFASDACGAAECVHVPRDYADTYTDSSARSRLAAIAAM